MEKKTFIKKWVLANFLGMLIAYLLYTPIGHGFTGGHGYELTPIQLFAHIIALGVVGLILFLFQKSLLKQFFEISRFRILIAIIAFNLLFWIGYYQQLIPDGPDTDILLGFLALGSGMWVGAIPFRGNSGAYILALLSFPLASFVAEVILLVVVTSMDLKVDMQNGMLHHSIFWLSIGTITGLLGGWISGMALYRMLSKNAAT